MGKTGKLKKKSTSVHSRAARRGNSPSDADKSLESVPRVEVPTKPSSVLAVHANAGISKKKTKGKNVTRAQRLRQQKGIERAETVMDQLESKVAKSVGRAKSISARKSQWEDLNGKQSKAMNMLLQAQGNDDEQMDAEPSSAAPKASKRTAHAKKPAETPLPPVEHETADDDDNIT